MTALIHRSSQVWLMAVALAIPSPALAQTAGQSPPPAAVPDKPEERSTGLPPHVEWTFNFDAGWGTFGFANSYYNNPKSAETEDLSDQWFEGYVKPSLSATYRLASSSEFYGKASVVGERTYGSAPELYGPDVSSFSPEDAAIGWRSGKSIGSSENLLDVSVGRVPYQLGHGFLLWDGAAEGGSRGGYWTNARKAFAFGAIGRVKPGPHKIEAFYLDKDDLNENETGTRLSGTNYEVTVGKDTTLGVTYMKFFAHADVKPGRDGLNVFNVRADSSVPRAPDVSFQFEYAAERNGDALDSNAWTAQGGYQFSSAGWKPKLSYRYASFQGDNPSTTANEAFDPLLLGFSDWGSWWQGEIAGEYFLSNSNLISHQIRAHVTPNDKVGGGLIFYDFRIDHPQALGATVTDNHAAFEGDLYIDWKLTRNLLMSVVTAFADPGTAVTQLTGRTKNFAYGMVYLAYSY
jgi:Alginate export